MQQEDTSGEAEGEAVQRCRYPNPPFDEEIFRNLYTNWKAAVGDDTLLAVEGYTEDRMRKSCEKVCNEFPRGEGLGELLWEPVATTEEEDAPLEHRGVSGLWLHRVGEWLRALLSGFGSEEPIIPTRIFVALFVEPMVHPKKKKQQQQPTVSGGGKGAMIPLYYFVPPKYRGKPQIFLSHSWDSWFRDLLFSDFPSSPKTTTTTEATTTTIATKLSATNADTAKSENDNFFWLDIFAIVQDPGSVKQKEEVATIGKVVRSIGQTCLVVPGNGSIRFALLPARRSWCCFEIAFAKHLSVRLGVDDPALLFRDVDSAASQHHQRFASEVCRLRCADAEASNQAERASILEILEKEMGLVQADRTVRREILWAFYERYELDPCPVTKVYSEALRDVLMVDNGGGEGQQKHKKAQKEKSTSDRASALSNTSGTHHQAAAMGIVEVKPSDVLFGRGGQSNNHHGNKMYHGLLKQRAWDYWRLRSRTAKAKFVGDVVSKLRHEHGVRFLHRDKATGTYSEATPKECQRKVGQKLRELAYDITKQEKEKGTLKKDLTETALWS